MEYSRKEELVATFNTGVSPQPPLKKRWLTNKEFCDTIEYMKKYKVQVTEVLSRIIEVEAEDESDAIEEAHRQYREAEIILDSEDGCGVEIDIVE